jgi:hypothetical protein
MTVNFTNMTTFNNMLATANDATNGLFWTSMYFMFIVVLFMSMLAFGWEIALMVAGFGGIVVGVLLLYMGLMSGTYLGIIVGLEVFMVIYMMWSSQKNQ